MIYNKYLDIPINHAQKKMKGGNTNTRSTPRMCDAGIKRTGTTTNLGRE